MIVANWPDADDIERYADLHGLEAADIIRDIVRLATLANLADGGALTDDFVLTGGMALRLRGSSRFTIKDTDTSLKGRLDELELVENLSIVEGDELTVTPDGGERWGRKTPRLTDVKPVGYKAYFASATPDPVEGEFSFTVNQRGLSRKPVWVQLTHPYPELTFRPTDLVVPVMNVAEQAAEKIVGWAAASLVKHYIDLAWIGRQFGDTIEPGDLEELVQKKLDIGYATFPAAYERLRTVKDLIVPLGLPREWQGPLNRDGDNGASRIRFMGEKISFDDAIDLIKRTIVPKLFGGVTP